MKSRDLSVAVLLVLPACIAPAPDTEAEGAADRAQSLELVASITGDEGWPGGRTVSSTMEVTAQDANRIEISAPRHVVATEASFRVGIDQGWGQWVSTTMAFVLYHRPYGSSAEWAPVGCSLGSYGSFRPTTKDGTFVLWEKVKVDMSWRRFNGFNGLLGDAAFMEFENCGVMEAYPEFGVVALPLENWNDMADDYGYTLSVSCLDPSGTEIDCGAYPAPVPAY